MGRSVAEKYLNSHAYADIDSPKSDKGIRDRYVRYKRTLENLTMMSDALMRVVLKKQDCTEYILRIIMGIDNLSVTEQTIQSYVIFITRGDPLGCGIPVYHIGRKIYETQDDFKDGTHIIYVNSKIQDDTKLDHLMHDLNCKDADADVQRDFGSAYTGAEGDTGSSGLYVQ